MIYILFKLQGSGLLNGATHTDREERQLPTCVDRYRDMPA